jgi:hypothetical protein
VDAQKPYIRLFGRDPQGTPYNYKDLVRPPLLPLDTELSTANGDIIISSTSISGGLGGAGTADQLAYWSDPATLTSSNKISRTSTAFKLATGYIQNFGTPFAIADVGTDYLTIMDSVNGGIRLSIKNTNAGAFPYSAIACISDEDNNAYLRINNTTQSAGGLSNTPGAAVFGCGAAGVGAGPGNRPLIIENLNNDASSHIIFGTRNTDRGRWHQGGAFIINQTAPIGSEIFRAAGSIYIDSDIQGNDTTRSFKWTASTGQVLINTQAAPATSQLRLTANTLGSLSGLVYSADNVQLGFDVDWQSSGWIARHAAVCWVNKVASALNIYGSTGNAVGSAPTQTFIGLWDLSNGFMSLNNTTARRRLDVLDAANPQIRCTQADNSKYTDLKTDSSDNFIIQNTNTGDIFLNAGGKVKFGTLTALGAEVITGYITIKDAGGTSRKIAVIS